MMLKYYYEIVKDGEYMLNNQSEVPLYQQLSNIIKDKILTGEYKTGQLLPSEAKLCDFYRVSRITVRNAIQELVEQDILIKKHGKGTFIKENKFTSNLCNYRGFTSTCREKSIPVYTHVLCLKKQSPTTSQIRSLNLQPEDFVVYLERLRFADGHPVIIEHTYLPFHHYQFLLHKDMENRSLYETIAEETGVNPEEYCLSNIELETCGASPEEAHYLKISTGNPLFILNETIYTLSRQPVHHTQQIMSGNYFKFTLSNLQNKLTINL